MALVIVKAESVAAGIVSDRRLYLNADKSAVVEDGDRDAAYLFATEGTVIVTPDVERYGLAVKDEKVVLAGAVLPAPQDNPLDGINWASDAAAEAAIKANLTAADFVGLTPKKASGFSKAEVEEIAAKKQA